MGYIIIGRLHGGVGDFITLTSLIREINIKYPQKKIILITGNKEIFLNNSRINKLIWIKNNIVKSLILRIFRLLESIIPNLFCYYYYKNSKYNSLEEEIRAGNRENYQKLLSKHWNLNINYENLKNEIYFTEEEKIEYNKKFKKLPKEYLLIHSEGKTTYTFNKEIGSHNIQKIIDQVENINWIQIGNKNDYKLKNINFDLRGKTSLRELFFLMSKSKGVICQEGMYNHLANAFNISSITLFTGFSPKEIYVYKNTIPIQISNLPNCSPCMKLEKCNKNFECINDEIVQKTVSLLTKKGNLL